jgi:hypothetical protein
MVQIVPAVAASSEANSASLSTMDAAATFCSRWDTLDVPGMGSMTGLRRSSHAKAICPTLAWCTRAISSSTELGWVSAPAASGYQACRSEYSRHRCPECGGFGAQN